MIISSFVRIVIDTIILVFSSKTGKRFVSDQETVLESCMKKNTFYSQENGIQCSTYNNDNSYEIIIANAFFL